MSELTPELRAEIDQILRTSDIRHAMVFRDMERGLNADQMAPGQRTSPANARKLVRSVQHLLEGTLPTSASMALTNSYVYRELLNFNPSPALRAYAKRCLRHLAAHNPSVCVDKALGPVTLYDSRTLARRVTSARLETVCPTCYLTLPCECN